MYMFDLILNYRSETLLKYLFCSSFTIGEHRVLQKLNQYKMIWQKTLLVYSDELNFASYLCSCKDCPSMIARNSKIGSIWKIGVFLSPVKHQLDVKGTLNLIQGKKKNRCVQGSSAEKKRVGWSANILFLLFSFAKHDF